MPYIENKFEFLLNEELSESNNRYRVHFNNVCVVLGGLVLPVSQVTPKNTSVDIKSRSWMNKEDLGLRRERNTERTNRDGSVTKIQEVMYTRPDGTKVTETTENTYEPDYLLSLLTGDNPFLTLDHLFDALHPNNRGSHTITVTSNTPREFPKKSHRTTVTQKPGSAVEEVEEVTRSYDPTQDINESAISRRKYIRRVDETKPRHFSKPAILIGCTGERFEQYLGSNNDLAWWNDDMSSSGGAGTTIENSTEELVIKGSQNIKRTVTDREVVDPDGNILKEIITLEEPYIDPIQRLQNNQENTTQSTTTSEGTTETTVSKTIDKFGNVINETERTVKRSFQNEETTTEETSSDGTKTTRTSKKTVDPATGAEILTEVEEIRNNTVKSTITRSESIDYDSNIKTITLTRNSTDSYGYNTTEEKVFKYYVNKEIKTVEAVKEELDDDIFENIVHGHFVMEFEFSGEVLEEYLVKELMTKNYEHQRAWAMIDLLEQQLDLGARLDVSTKKRLYEEYLRIFSGNLPVGETVRGGTVLDRISLEVFGERFELGCVFAKNDGFRINWIPGTDRMYSWTLKVQIFNNIIENSHNIPHMEVPFAIVEHASDVLPGDYSASQ